MTEEQQKALLESAEEVSKWAEHRPDGTYSVPQLELDALRAALRDANKQ